jgi:adenylate cyclase
MGKEIERKFLVRGDAWRNLSEGVLFRQGYLCRDRERTVRVRIAGTEGYLTVKGITTGAARSEFEYSIPLDDAGHMMDELCEKPLIEKTRYTIACKDLNWEIDEFLGDNRGLIVAEVELEHEDQEIEIPPWIGDEVTGDSRYYNSNLAKNPFATW